MGCFSVVLSCLCWFADLGCLLFCGVVDFLFCCIEFGVVFMIGLGYSIWWLVVGFAFDCFCYCLLGF